MSAAVFTCGGRKPERLKHSPFRGNSGFRNLSNYPGQRCWFHISHLVASATADVTVAALLKSGGRFSRNAEKASLASGERSRKANSSFSRLIAASTCSRDESRVSLLQARSAS